MKEEKEASAKSCIISKIRQFKEKADEMNKILDCYKYEKEIRLKITEEILNFYKNLREDNEELKKIDAKPNL